MRARHAFGWMLIVKQVRDGCNIIVQTISLAVALAAVEVVRALVGPHAAVDRARYADCHTDDSTDHKEGDEDADDQSLVLGVASPMVLDGATAASAVLTTLLLVRQTSLPQSLVGRPHGAFLVACADSIFLAERVLVVVVSARFQIFFRSESSLCGSLVGGNALVRRRWVSVEGRVRREWCVV